MCGICGFIERGGAASLEAAPSTLAPMLARIAHRGPDGEGVSIEARDGWVMALGHRRLAIIDLASGAQPMALASGSTVTYNGELYTFRAVRAALQERGRVFHTGSDTEVLLTHLDEHGPADLPRALAALDGMFAFALWDAPRRRLVLARDRAGIKPLVYAALAGGGIAFASELASLMQHPGVSRAASDAGLASYFFSDYAQAPQTLLDGARKLEPGHYVVWQDGVLAAPRPFWSPGAPAPARNEAPRTLARMLWRTLDGAVDRQLVADVPVGVFLSGGLDSASVATLARARGTRPLKAFSIAFEDPTFDESAHARTVAESIGAEHVLETLRERDLLDVFERAVDHLDEPLADPSYLPTYLLSRLAAREVKVVLSGDGGDELWGGYPTYRAYALAGLYGRIPAFLRNQVLAALVARLPIDDRYQSLEWKLRRFTGRYDDDPVTRHLRWMSSVDLPDLPSALPHAAGLVPETLRAALPASPDVLARILTLDFATYLPGSVLAKVDRASMAHGLEVRPPLLDNAMIDLALSVPSATKLRGGRAKAVLRDAARGQIPASIVARTKKGFGIPLAAWLRGPLREPLQEVLSRSPVWSWGALDRPTFQVWNDAHQARRADRSKPLWALLVLHRWLRRNGL